MFLHYNIHNNKDQLTKDFDSKEIASLSRQAIKDLINRNKAGTILVPFSYLIGTLTTEYATEQSFLFSFLGTILSVAIICRISAIIALTKKEHIQNHIWLPIFFWSNIFTGIVWGCFAATAVVFYHDSLSITLIMTLLAGISGSSMASYCVWRTLAYSFLLVILLPTIITQLYLGNNITVPIGMAIFIFLIFNLIQAKLWNNSYWVSLVNTFLIKKNAVDLNKLNTQLIDEVANHKITAQAIAISRKKLQDIYHSAHDGFFIFQLDGQAVDVNETLLNMFQITREQALKFNIHRNSQSGNNKTVDLQTIWQEALKGHDQEFEWLIKKANHDGLFTLQVNFRKCLWGEHSVVLATIRDITPQVFAMQATLAANRSKSEFLANMSHELRTPMHGILGYARLGIKRSGSVPREKLNEYFDLIRQSGTRLMDLLNNVLDFAKLDVGKMCYNMSLNDLIPRIYQVTTEFNSVAVEKKLSFTVECNTTKAIAYFDHEKIIQVLRNILFNAIKFSNEGTEIRIHCQEIKQDTDTPRLQISVFNTGASIPENELDTIFEKFIQSSATDTGAGGTGLGLAIARQIISDHNSSIWAENAPDGSTVFRFTLPVKRIGLKDNHK